MSYVSEPSLSVCMPVYNGSKYIKKSIESVLNQTFTNFRLVVCDNCSIDDTPEIVKSFGDPRIKYLRNDKNLGLVGNHNRCLEVANTRYVNIWHDDDIMMPENLEKKIYALEDNPHVGLIFSNVERIDEAGGSFSYRWHEDTQTDYVEEGGVIFRKYLQTMHRGALFFIGAVVARKECMIKAGGFRPNYSPLTCDSELWLRMLLATHGACLGEPLVKYRQYADNTTSEYRGVHFLEEHFNVIEGVFDELRHVIADRESLKAAAQERFVRHALRKGRKSAEKGDFETAREYIRWARKFRPVHLMNIDLWRLQLRLTMGPRGRAWYRSAKTALARVIARP